MSGGSVWSGRALLRHSAFNPILLMPEDDKKANVTVPTFQ